MPHCHWPPWSFNTFIFLLFLFLLLNPQSPACCSTPTNQTLVNSPFFSFSTSLPGLHSRQLGLNNTFIKASPKSTKCNQTPTLLLSLHTSTSHTLPSCKYWSLQGHFSCEDIADVLFCTVKVVCTEVPFISFRILKRQVTADVNLKMKSDKHKMVFGQRGKCQSLERLADIPPETLCIAILENKDDRWCKGWSGWLAAHPLLRLQQQRTVELDCQHSEPTSGHDRGPHPTLLLLLLLLIGILTFNILIKKVSFYLTIAQSLGMRSVRKQNKQNKKTKKRKIKNIMFI